MAIYNVDYVFSVSCLVYAVLATALVLFPNGSFTKNLSEMVYYPLVKKSLLCLSSLYLVLILSLMFLQQSDIIDGLQYMDRSIASRDDSRVIHNLDCNLSLGNILSHIDTFMPGHVAGWTLKSMHLRHCGLAWTSGVVWEITEAFLSYSLPQFSECWWDSLLFDAVLCNTIGIAIGMMMLESLKLHKYNWAIVVNAKCSNGVPMKIFRRSLVVFAMMLLFQVAEMNIFLIKHIFHIPSKHALIMARWILVLLISFPLVNQYYHYMTTTNNINSFSIQSKITFAIFIAEFLLCIRFDAPHPEVLSIIAFVIFIAIVNIIFVALCNLFHSFKSKAKSF